MKSLAKLTALANRFKIKLAQNVSAQPGDIESSLKSAQLWDLSKDVASLVAAAGVPDTSTIDLHIVVSTGPVVGFDPVLTPEAPQAADKLKTLLIKKYALPMATALQKAGMSVAEPVTVSWLKY